jgi:hypothetical protein
VAALSGVDEEQVSFESVCRLRGGNNGPPAQADKNKAVSPGILN